MSDISCAKCGEPWDSYGISPSVCRDGHGDVSLEEAERFRKGEGCPSCGFGTTCPSCGGSGATSSPGCSCSHGKLLARRMLGKGGDWQYGYLPTVRTIPAGSVRVRKLRSYQCRDGWVEEAWFTCPNCLPEPGKPKYPCDECEGDGKLHRENKDEIELHAAEEACEASDEDPIQILIDRGLL